VPDAGIGVVVAGGSDAGVTVLLGAVVVLSVGIDVELVVEVGLDVVVGRSGDVSMVRCLSKADFDDASPHAVATTTSRVISVTASRRCQRALSPQSLVDPVAGGRCGEPRNLVSESAGMIGCFCRSPCAGTATVTDAAHCLSVSHVGAASASECGSIVAVLISQLCTLDSLISPALQGWSDRLRPMWDPAGTDPKPTIVHRKMWEWLFICQALAERGALQPGRRGLGFGVGREPLVALFAGLGCEIVATDLQPDAARAAGWTDTGDEYTGGLEGLNDYDLCPPERFSQQVTYRYVDMNDVPDDLRGFDFTWSSCAFEHLGDLDAGMDFVVEQMRCLAPGGVAVHTTELNVSSDEQTVVSGATVLYRRRDIKALAARLRRLGYRIDYDLTEGNTPADRHVDVPPFSDTHLRTTLGEFVTTSVGLVIEKSEGNGRRRPFRRHLTR
jgi:SAM-dependent methyltransferase